MCQIHPTAVIDESVKLGENITIGPNSVIESKVSIGDGTTIGSNVVIYKNTCIGKNNQLFSNCVIGGRPQILGSDANTKFGKLVIGDGNTIRENVTIHPSMYPDKTTVIGNNNLIMIGVHIGHDCVIEDNIVMSNFVQVSGHCKICTGAWLSGMVLLHQFVTIGRWCYAAGLAGINHDVPPFVIISGHYPAKVRGINKRGLSRADINEAQQKSILDAYKKLYRGNGTLLEKAKNLAQSDDLDENIRDMVDAIIKSSKHRFGRHLETLRH